MKSTRSHHPAPALSRGSPDQGIDVLASDVDRRMLVQNPTSESLDGASRHWLRPGWPVGLLLVGAPLWWAAGISDLILPILAAPLAWQLRKRRIRTPPGFWIWVLFLAWVAVSAVMLNYTVPNTAISEGIGRYIAYTVRFLQYIAVTVILLWIGNSTERELSRTRVVRWICWLGVASIVLGIAALLYPTGAFPTVKSQVVPEFLVQGDGLAHLAQVQEVLGDTSPRPAAPFEYTNDWGSVVSVSLVWLAVGWWVLGTLGKRILMCCLFAAAAIPIVYSLNRAMWAGLLIACVYVIGRLALRGRLLAGFIGLLAASVAAVLFVVSPLGVLVQDRFDNPTSNEVRAALADAAWNAAEASPIIGAGSTRDAIGSERSIAIGPRPGCEQCGYRVIGSTGQFWLLLVSQGFVGAALYMGFLLRSIWAGRHDASALGIAATLALTLQIFYSFFYAALPVPLTIAMLAVALLWRNAATRETGTTGTPAYPVDARGRGARRMAVRL